MAPEGGHDVNDINVILSLSLLPKDQLSMNNHSKKIPNTSMSTTSTTMTILLQQRLA